MPFTISHAAVVLPVQNILRRHHLLSAAIIGTMVPDFGLVLPLGLGRSTTHGVVALFTFCLPMGLLAWWLFQSLIKPALLELMADRWYLRVAREHPPARLRQLRTWLLVLPTIWIGAVSHLVLDGFTHEHGRGTRLIPSLEEATVLIAGREILVYRILQYILSVIGLALIAIALWRWLHSTTPAVVPERRFTPKERRRWLLALLVLPLFAVLRAAVYLMLAVSRFGGVELLSGRALARLAVDGLVAVVMSLLVVSALIRLRLSR